MTHRELNIAWLGSIDGPCAQLLERVKEVCSADGRALRIEVLTLDAWNCRAALDADRIVITCETRLDYPWQTIAGIESLDAHVPWGVVTGLWHAGSRRTGIGPVTQWQLPWYRWWDGWRGWFFSDLARPKSQCPTQFDALTLPIDLATPSDVGLSEDVIDGVRTLGKGGLLIVATCDETAATWRLAAERAGWDSEIMDPHEVDELDSKDVNPDRIGAKSDSTAPMAILWDDSCQDRLPMVATIGQSCEQSRQLARRYPNVPIIAALALGHISAWPQLKAAGMSDFFVKPSHGLPLTDYLTSR